MMVMYNGLDENPKYLPNKKLVELVERGNLGDKSGQGVYTYRDG
jgi:3-hydroxyacyl-CoA dehydrogenase